MLLNFLSKTKFERKFNIISASKVQTIAFDGIKID